MASPGDRLVERVREIAKDVAGLCDDLTDAGAAACFDSLFGTGPDCGLFHEFLISYRRSVAAHPYRRPRGTRQQLEHFIRIASHHRARAAGSGA